MTTTRTTTSTAASASALRALALLVLAVSALRPVGLRRSLSGSSHTPLLPCTTQQVVAVRAELVHVDLAAAEQGWTLSNANGSISLPTRVPAHTLAVLADAGLVAADPLFRCVWAGSLLLSSVWVPRRGTAWQLDMPLRLTPTRTQHAAELCAGTPLGTAWQLECLARHRAVSLTSECHTPPRYGEREARWVADERGWNFTRVWSSQQHAVLTGCRHVCLVLHGLDTFGSVVLNGRHVLEAHNAHRLVRGGGAMQPAVWRSPVAHMHTRQRHSRVGCCNPRRSWWLPLNSSRALREGANLLSVVLRPAAEAAAAAQAAYPYPVPTMQVLCGCWCECCRSVGDCQRTRHPTSGCSRPRLACALPDCLLQVPGGAGPYNFARKPAFDFGWVS
jgi:hypothetical protein